MAKKLKSEGGTCSKSEMKLWRCLLMGPDCQLGDLFLNKLTEGQINRCFVHFTGCVSERVCVFGG